MEEASAGDTAPIYRTPDLEMFQVRGSVPIVVLEPSGEEAEAAVEDAEGAKQGLFKKLSAAIGLDITNMTIPVSYSEPISFLQRLGEGIEYYSYVDQACEEPEPLGRMLNMMSFAVSAYNSGTRVKKPFNPVLGETFQHYINEKRIRLLCEQVSHHPPIGAVHAECASWTYENWMRVKTKFGGNSIEVQPLARYRVTLNDGAGSGTRYCWDQLTTVAHNVIVGKTWIDHFGPLTITSSDGYAAYLHMKKCGFMSKNWHVTQGSVHGPDGQPVGVIAGKWNEALFYLPIEKKMVPFFPVDVSTLDKKGIKERDRICTLAEKRGRRVWSVIPIPTDKGNTWNWSSFVHDMNEIDDDLFEELPKTDSRLRPDRLALELGNTRDASKWKKLVEQRQRDEAKERAARRQQWRPRYFEAVEDDPDQMAWRYNGIYWDRDPDGPDIAVEVDMDAGASSGEVDPAEQLGGTTEEDDSDVVPETPANELVLAARRKSGMSPYLSANRRKKGGRKG